MRTRSLVFILILCAAFAWVWAAYKYSGEEIVNHGLLWSAIAIGVVLGFVIAERLFGFWRNWRARRAARPKPPKAPPAAVPEDVAALQRLWEEASARLAASPELGAQGQRLQLENLPLTLLIGPTGSGKTATLVNSGLEPHLLAGETQTDGPYLPSKLANFWIARQNLFVEIAGAIWEKDNDRWREFLRGFLAETNEPVWKRLFKDRPARASLRAVVLFEEMPHFTGSTDANRVTRISRTAQDRLQAIVDVFGLAVPIYVVFTKTDAVKFYDDFYARFPDAEVVQAVGHGAHAESNGNTGTTAESEQKKLTKAFGTVCHRLSDRRVLHLARETDTSKKPGIYEFPREFRRIRSVLVQFLAETFRPSPLKTTPPLRGFYFTGTRQVDFVPQPSPNTGTFVTGIGERTGTFSAEATHIFRPDATQLFRPDDPLMSSLVRPRGTRQQWMFCRELLEEIIPNDSLAVVGSLPVAPRTEPRLERYRRALAIAVTTLAVVLSLVWLQSWWGNRQLLKDVQASMESAKAASREPDGSVTLAALQRLDGLRRRVEILDQGGPWRLHWGLYTGDHVRPAARALYFQRFRALLLDDLNRQIVQKLTALPASPAPNDPDEPVYNRLATHLTISGASCDRDKAMVASVLKEEAASIVPEEERKRLADRQIDYYASVLDEDELPVKVGQDAHATENSRAYLRQLTGASRIYCGILQSANRSLPPLQLKEFVGYANILSVANLPPEPATCSSPPPGAGEVPGAFTAKGLAYVQEEAKKENRALAGDTCVLGPGARRTDKAVTAEIMRLYLQDYKRAWRRLLAHFSVTRYKSPEDAIQKLETLASYKSPVLGLLAFTSRNTTFAKQTEQPTTREALGQAASKIPLIGSLAKKGESAEKAAKALAPAEPEESPGQITDAFDVVHRIVPDPDQWLTKTQKYAEALSGLRLGLQGIERMGGQSADAATIQQALAAYDKAQEEVRILTTAELKPVGSEGVDSIVLALLKQPITDAKRFIPDNPEKAAAGKLNGDLAKLCTELRRVGGKFPFSQNASQEASLDEVATLFAPAKGAIWQYQQESLGQFVVREGSRWVEKPDSKPKLAPEILGFLNRSQEITDALFPAGAAQPRLRYSLRPVAGTVDNRDIIFDFDGTHAVFSQSSILQKDFFWPAPPGAAAGAKADIQITENSLPFARRSGLWGVFHVFMEAEPRAIGAKQVEWKRVRGAGGEISDVKPPVRMEFVQFPNGIDLFNPSFFRGLACPNGGRAVQ